MSEWNPIARTSENRAPSQLLPRVHLLAIIDRSASMAGCEQLTTVALREFFEELKKHRARYSVRLAEFSKDVEIHAPQPLEKTSYEYKADGTATALWDAMGQAMVSEKSREELVVCLIVSDGEENASRELKRPHVQAMIQAREELGNWIFLFLNLQGKPNRSAQALGIQCLDYERENISKGLKAVAAELSRTVVRLSPGAGMKLISGRKDGNGR
jgi:hypothetical protein